MGERSVYQDSTDSLLEIKAKNDYLFFFFHFFLATLRSLWDLSSLTRDRTWALNSESTDEYHF